MITANNLNSEIFKTWPKEKLDILNRHPALSSDPRLFFNKNLFTTLIMWNHNLNVYLSKIMNSINKIPYSETWFETLIGKLDSLLGTYKYIKEEEKLIRIKEDFF